MSQNHLRHHAFATLHELANQFLVEGEEYEKQGIVSSKPLASIIFSAFCLEAYANHVGEYLLGLWNEQEKTGTVEKLATLHQHFKLKFDRSRRPIQTAINLFKFRSEIVHGRTRSAPVTSMKKTEDGWEFVMPTTDFPLVKANSAKKARRTFEDVTKIIKTIYSETDEKYHTFANEDGSGVSIFNSGIWGTFRFPD